MARNRKTDHDTAVAAALELFWQRGYSGASTREIEEKTGLTRFTLQTAYGGKEGFFLDTLDAYLDNAEQNHFPDPETCDLEALANWFVRLVDCERMPGRDQTGCLAFNSISEFGRDDAEVNKRIERYLTVFEERALAIIGKAAARGELDTALEPQELSRILVNLLLGLHSVIKARSEDSLPRQHAGSIANLILSWRKHKPQSDN